jgi:ATP-dependent Clp protease ATP-binding subunit ClpA
VFEHLDPDARRIVDVAQHEARALHHNYLGTEHLLLALALQAGAPARLLVERGCGPKAIRDEITLVVGRGHPQRHDPDALLATLGIDLGEVRRRVESTFGPDAVTTAAGRARPRRRRWPGARWWPGCDQGRPCDSALLGGQWIGLAPRVKRVVELAVAAAAPSPVTPSHLLLAILDEGKGVACQILARRRVDLPALASAVRATLS